MFKFLVKVAIVIIGLFIISQMPYFQELGTEIKGIFYEKVDNVVTEVDRVKGEVEETKEKVINTKNKVVDTANKVKETTDKVGEALNSVNDAIDSVDDAFGSKDEDDDSAINTDAENPESTDEDDTNPTE